MRLGLAFVACLAFAASLDAGDLPPVQTVFIIVLENANWSNFDGNPDAPFVNGTLMPVASYCDRYYNPPGIHPSLPNYLWLEAGTNFGILDDNDPSANHQSTTNHLVTLLDGAGISWRAYMEDIDGTYVPLVDTNEYAVHHNPFAYFDNVTGTNNPNDAYGIAHIRPYSELASDLTNNSVARYNFISPNLCHDGHDSCPPLNNPVRQTDEWLSTEIPRIMESPAYLNGGALFITWDEASSGDGPIGLILLSPMARGQDYSSNTRFTHSSLLRTVQELFGVMPLLGDAADATDLSELFSSANYAITNVVMLPGGEVQFEAMGVVPGGTNVIEASTDLGVWTPIGTNIVSTNGFEFVDPDAVLYSRRFYRLEQAP